MKVGNMQAELKRFSAGLKKFSKKVDLQVRLTEKQAAIETFKGVVKRTPVGSGAARGSWFINVGRRSTENPATPNNVPSESDVLSRANKLSGKGGKSGAIYITNGIPYIKKLENGDSQQAPNGMVAVTMAEVRARLKAKKR